MPRPCYTQEFLIAQGFNPEFITPEFLKSIGLAKSAPSTFFDLIIKTDACWIYQGSKNAKGYGIFHGSWKKSPWKAHRLSWVIHKGPIPEGMCVLHDCPFRDNPACVNPAHLWLGTVLQNNEDMVKKGVRVNPPHRCGEDCGKSKLTWVSVNQMRILYANGSKLPPLAIKYGVSEMTIRRVVNNETWKRG